LTDKQIIQQLLKDFEALKKENARLVLRVAELEEKLSKYENPKNSKNSSIPPSQDPNRVTQSLRKKSNKKVGGQKGHKGNKLNKVSNPDEIILHDVTQCECCNALLPEDGEVKSRQVFDIPKIKIKVTEHRIIIKKCTGCGAKNKSDFPEELVQEAQYGNQIKSFGVYLQNYQMIPYSRCVELLFDLTGHRISQGSLANFQSKMFNQLDNFENEIKTRLLQAPVLNVDETGVRVNGKGNWMHVASNKLLSHFGFHSKRGKQAIDSFNILPLYNGTITHDRFSPYFKYQCEHSLCNAHILRELLYLWEVKKVKWAKDISNLLINVLHRQKCGKEFTDENYQNILKRWEELIAPIINGYDKIYKKTKEEKLAFALEKHKHLFLKFIKEKEVPFDNNQAERDLRMIKVKQKISGCFREDAYAEYFARARSFISTLKKNELNILENVHLAISENEFFPNLAE
jgi:transposase